MTGDSKFVFRKATPEELEQARREHHSSWAGGLNVERYIGREHHLASQKLTRNGGITFWVLTDAAKPSKILCSCESIKKEAIVGYPDGRTEMVVSQVIGSVFTPPRNRGKGYASVMLEMLGEALARDCLFDALYSDIGKRFYAKMGWMPYLSTHISLPPAGEKVSHSEDVKLLYPGDLPDLCREDVRNTVKDFEARPLAPGVDARVAYLPTHDIMRWHHAREEYVGKLLTGKKPTIKGAWVGTGKRWCIWTRTFNMLDDTQKMLNILRMVDTDDGEADSPQRLEEIAQLLRAAQKEARLWGMKGVLIWNPSAAVVGAVERILGRKVEVETREVDSIASLRWNGPQGRNANVQWDLNEKFGWC